MAEASAQNPTKAQSLAPLAQMDVLWITAGLGCDGDTISMTAATQPSVEDLILGTFPWVPKMKLHNPFLAYENGDDFLRPFHLAAEGKLAPFILVVEGSIPDENNKKEGYWASLGTDEKTGQPILGRDCVGNLCDLWRDSRYGGKSDRMHGSGRLSWLELEVGGANSDCLRAGMSGAARQHDGDFALFVEYGGGSSADDSAG
jgi:hypothetical protein